MDRLDADPASKPVRPFVGRALALRVAVAVGVVLLAVLATRGLRLRDVQRVLVDADLTLLVVATPTLLGLNLLLRGARFAPLVRALPIRTEPASYLELTGSLLISQAANNVLPLRAGELVRTRDLLRRGYALGDVAFAYFTDKVVELVSITLWAAPLAFAGLVHTSALVGPLVVIALAVALLVAIAKRVRALETLRARLGRYAREPALLGRSLIASLAADASDLALIAACLSAVGIAPGWREVLGVFVGVNLALAIPSTPGQVGAFEAGAVLALVAFGIPQDRAVAFALVYRVVQWVPVTAVGWLVSLVRRPIGVGATGPARPAP